MESTQNDITDMRNELKTSLGGMTFGIDAAGRYGYIKAGADTVIPFKNGLEIAENINNDTSAYRNNKLYLARVTNGSGFCNISAEGSLDTVTVYIGSRKWILIQTSLIILFIKEFDNKVQINS